MEACHYSYCLPTFFMQNYIHRLEYSITQLEPRKVVMKVIKTSLSDLANDDPLEFNLFSWTFPREKKHKNKQKKLVMLMHCWCPNCHYFD